LLQHSIVFQREGKKGEERRGEEGERSDETGIAVLWCTAGEPLLS